MRTLTARLLLLAILTAGCGRGDTPASSSAPPNDRNATADSLNVNGVRYELPQTGSDMDRATEFLKAVRADGVSWSGGGHTLEVAGGKIKVDGKDHGTIQQGDTLRLAPDGQLFVNGKRREATGK